MKRVAWLPLLTAAGVLLAAEGFEKSIAVPRSGETRLGWSKAGCTVESVSLQNYPDRDDIDKARKEKPDDKSWVWWNFHVENRGDGKCKIHLWVDVYDKSGQIAKSSDRSDTVEPKKDDDNIRVSTRMRTIDIADSPRAVVRADIQPK